MAEANFQAFAGLRNDVSAERFGPTDLTAAVNVDLDDTGRLSRRDGYVLRLAAADVHSLWSDGRICLFVEAGTLKRLHEDFTATVIRAGMGADPVSYASVNGRVYLSNGTTTAIIDEAGNTRSWGIEVPGLPLAAAAGGSLPYGLYQFVLTYVREDGQESGAGLAGLIECEGGIAFSSIPVSSDPGVSHKILYISTQNGDLLYRAAVLPNAATTYTWTGGALSLPLATQYLEPAPAGEIVAYAYGVLYVVQGANVFYSSPYGYELFDPRNYLPFDSPVQVFAPVEGGIWVGTQKEIYWIDGVDPDKAQKATRASVGSTKGTVAYLNSNLLPDAGQPESQVAVWWTDDGVVAGYPGGLLKELTKGRYRPAFEAQTGAAMTRNTGNGVQYVAIVNH